MPDNLSDKEMQSLIAKVFPQDLAQLSSDDKFEISENIRLKDKYGPELNNIPRDEWKKVEEFLGNKSEHKREFEAKAIDLLTQKGAGEENARKAAESTVEELYKNELKARIQVSLSENLQTLREGEDQIIRSTVALEKKYGHPVPGLNVDDIIPVEDGSKPEVVDFRQLKAAHFNNQENFEERARDILKKIGVGDAENTIVPIEMREKVREDAEYAAKNPVAIIEVKPPQGIPDLKRVAAYLKSDITTV